MTAEQEAIDFAKVHHLRLDNIDGRVWVMDEGLYGGLPPSPVKDFPGYSEALAFMRGYVVNPSDVEYDDDWLEE